MSPRRRPQRCSEPRCSGIAVVNGRCDEHRPSGWKLYRRLEDQRTTLDRLGVGEGAWGDLWVATMASHRGICHVCGKPGADQVDHVIAVGLGGAKTDPENLAPIHSDPCHGLKTARELVLMKALARRRRNA